MKKSVKINTVKGFTMIEIAISLAIIGIALVGIIGVLPLGLNTQRDNREQTVIDQDATVFMEAVRNGQRGSDDLTNYVYAIVNTGSNPVGYTNALAGQMGFSTADYPSVVNWLPFLTSGSNIVGLLSTPEYVYTDTNGNPKSVPNLNFGGVSNHIYALVRSMSGPVSEKPPQDNSIIVGDSFSYRILCVNGKAGIDPTLFLQHPAWQARSYNAGDVVWFDWNYWTARIASEPPLPPLPPPAPPFPPDGKTQLPQSYDVPGQIYFVQGIGQLNPRWAKVAFYPLELEANQQELRQTFNWPILPNGNIGRGRETFRTTGAGSFSIVNNAGTFLYFLQQGMFSEN